MNHKRLEALVAGMIVAMATLACVGDGEDYLEGEELSDATELLEQRYQLTVWDQSNEDYRTTINAVVNVRSDGNESTIVARPCSTSLPSVLSFTPTLAEEGIRDVVVEAPLRVWSTGLSTETSTMQFGVELDDLDNRVPTDEDDRQVVDHDDDGRPGISIKVGLGRKVYAGVRVDFSLRGNFENPQVISGRAPMVLDQQIYGDNIPFFNARDAAEEANSLGRMSVRGYFEMTALDDASDSLSCDDVR